MENSNALKTTIILEELEVAENLLQADSNMREWS